MRRLILMRHAKSSWSDQSQRDLDRPLNKRGRRSAAVIGGWMAEKGYLPDLALVSSARRTQETWAGIVAAAGPAETTYVPELYHAGPDTMLEVLGRAGDAGCVLILGHQPGIGAFAAQVLSAPAADPEFARYPTCATTVVDLDIDDWTATRWGSGRLVDFIVPRTLE